MGCLDIYEEKKLLKLVAKGDEDAFVAIYLHYKNKIYRVALNYLKSPDLAEEIIQEVFLKIWLKRAELPNIKKFDAYLFIIARNIILDQLKKRAYEYSAIKELPVKPDFTTGTDDLIKEQQYKELLNEATFGLSPRQRQIFLLARREGKSQKEIAKELGLSYLTVKKQMANALKSIRQYLDKYLTFLF